MQQFGSIDTYADTGADLRLLLCLFVHRNLDVVMLAMMINRECSDEPANATTYNGNTKGVIFENGHTDIWIE